EEVSEQDTENKKDEPKKEEAVNEEVPLDLGDELEIEIEE
ncbi:DNA recombination/repair protein RecA, partial [Streptococcus pneumoniae]